MKKYIRIFASILCIASLLLVAGCGEKETAETASESGLTVINDHNFYNYYLAIDTNPLKYSGQKFEVEGMYYESVYEDTVTPMVFRYHREVDETDGNTYKYYRGFNLRGNIPENIEDKAWIKVTGTLGTEEHDGHYHVFIEVESFEICETRGNEYVE